MLSIPEEAGCSRGKITAVRDLAGRCLDGTVPAPTRLDRIEDEAIVEQLVAVRGIERWTVEMLLIFNFGWTDVLPVTDLLIRRGDMQATGTKDMPAPGQVLHRGERWRPCRSMSSYLWRASEL